MLHTHLFGPDDGPAVLALHGLTGHGRRWESLQREQLPQARVIAPDLLGHGRSPWTPPWGLADHAAAVGQVLDAQSRPDEPVVIVAHSFGALVALTLAHDRPDRIDALVLLDPAQGLDPEHAGAMAEATVAHWGYPDPAAAAAAKRAEGWGAVPEAVLAAEIDEHLVAGPDRHMWRVCVPATSVAWSEMARPPLLPPAGVPTDIVVADRVQPPFLSADFLSAAAQLPSVRVHHVDTEHMVPLLAPERCGELVRAALTAAAARS
ncbi:alpha/beta fold hydrolase [Gordonia sp. VNK21]|uniref:alpha/beta fold hydrolase n=1 Tax=Gordonia sp. VNK21 TaxID=3382483 RepID=UPI0038D3D8AF